MSIDEKINEALGISNDKPVTKAVVKKEYTPPVPRIEDKEKEDVDNDYKYSRRVFFFWLVKPFFVGKKGEMTNSLNKRM